MMIPHLSPAEVISRMVMPDFTILGKRRTLDHVARGEHRKRIIPSLAGSVGFRNVDSYIPDTLSLKKKKRKKKNNPFTTERERAWSLNPHLSSWHKLLRELAIPNVTFHPGKPRFITTEIYRIVAKTPFLAELGRFRGVTKCLAARLGNFCSSPPRESTF
jgi:hypothetical protein